MVEPSTLERVIEFRSVSPDEPSAHALLAEYFAERAAGFPAAQGDYRVSFPPASRFASGSLLVAVLDGEDVGIGGIRPLDDSTETASDARRFEVKHLYLRAQTRGHGVGRALLAELELRSAAAGATEVVLDSNDSLEAASRLYRAAGYRVISAYNDNPNATTWYGKNIDADRDR